MALANYDATLEYANNVLEFWLVDADGNPAPFVSSDTVFSIIRADETKPAIDYINPTIGTDGSAIFSIDPTFADLGQDYDDYFEYENKVYEHRYSLKTGSNVILTGQLKMVKVA